MGQFSDVRTVSQATECNNQCRVRFSPTLGLMHCSKAHRDSIKSPDVASRLAEVALDIPSRLLSS